MDDYPHLSELGQPVSGYMPVLLKMKSDRHTITWGMFSCHQTHDSPAYSLQHQSFQDSNHLTNGNSLSLLTFFMMT